MKYSYLNYFLISFFFILIIIFFSFKFFSKNKNLDVRYSQYIVYEDFPSSYVEPRNIEVWLPKQYNSIKRLPVLYMFDGQNIFHGKEGWIKNSYNHGWQIDETLDSITFVDKSNSMIVVGIFNIGLKRFSEYMPSKPIELFKKNILNQQEWKNRGLEKYGSTSDSLLKFIVFELKPFIDKTFKTKSNRENTFISGSSMGGLISSYALCEYPSIFGTAVCISTHWPALNGIYVEYLKENLPFPGKNKFYFDYGTQGLDSNYESFQNTVDSFLIEKGYVMNENWVTLKFNGHDHHEKYWKSRLNFPIKFMQNRF